MLHERRSIPQPVLPSGDDGTHFLIWFWDWFEQYLIEKGVSFEQIRETKAARLGFATAD